MKLTRVVVLLWAVGLPATALSQEAGRVSPTSLRLPNPILVFVGTEEYETGGKQWTRYNYVVDNLAAYPNDLFSAAPDLPPCGSNTKASRTWVDLYQQDGKRLYGFCALDSHDGLGRLWFALENGSVPPSWIYVEMNDRKTGTKLKSNLAETVL